MERRWRGKYAIILKMEDKQNQRLQRIARHEYGLLEGRGGGGSELVLASCQKRKPTQKQPYPAGASSKLRENEKGLAFCGRCVALLSPPQTLDLQVLRVLPRF